MNITYSNSPKFKHDIISILVLLIMLIILWSLSSCCPKITATEEIKTHTDTVYGYYTDTVRIKDSVPYQVYIDVDSLIQALTGINKDTSKPIVSHTRNGVTTSLIRKGNRIICQSTIDSLQAQVDSLKKITIKKEEVKTITKTVHSCESKFHWFVVRFFWFSLLFYVLRYAYIRLLRSGYLYL